MSIELASLSPWLLLWAPLVIVVAYTVFGLSGFGSTAIAVPILAHFVPVAYLVPLMVLLDLASSLSIGRTNRQHVATEEIKRILPFLLIGLILGLTVLVGVPDRYLRAALGFFAVAIGVHGIFNPVLHKAISKLWCIPAGILGGIVATIFGAGGPIYATYMSGRLADKSAVRSTVSTLISISAFSRVVLYALSGLLLHLSIVLGAVVLAPFAWIGLKIGGRIHIGLTQVQMRRAVGGLLVFTGLSLLARVFL